MAEFTAKNKYYFYNGLPKKAPVSSMKVTLKEAVEEKILCKAVENAIRKDYCFRQKPLLTGEGDILCVENDAKPPVMADDGTYVNLGSAATNGYLFRVLYRDHSIELRYSHALTDGRGGIMFLHTLLYEYFTLQGYPIEPDGNVFMQESVYNPAQIGDLAADLPEGITPKGPDNFGELFSTPEQRTLMEGDTSREFVIHFPAGELKELSQKLGATPAPVMAAVIAASMHEVYDVGEQTIVAGVPVDMRAFTGRRAMGNYSSMTFLPYEAALFHKDFAAQTKALSSSLRASLEKENLYALVMALSAGTGQMPHPPLNDKEQVLAMQRARMRQKGRFTYLLTNVGLIRLPKGMEAQIMAFALGSPSVSYTPSLLLYTFREHGCLRIVANYEESALPDAIRKRLNESGIHAKMEEGFTRSDNVLAELFERS